MELRQLRYFKAIVEAGSFTAAAATLQMSQPPLSMSIAKLETELGVELLVRSARGVRLTSAGAYLLDAASPILDAADKIAAQLTRYGEGAAGSLTIAAAPILMWRRIPRLLREHAREFPEVEVRLIDAPPWTAIDMVVTGAVDIAFVAISEPRTLSEQYRGKLHVVPWGSMPLFAVFGPDDAHLPDPVSLSVLTDRVVAMPKRTLALPSLPDVVTEAFAEHRVHPRETLTVDNIPTILPLIEAGLAASVLPDPQTAHADLIVRRITEDVPPLAVVAVVRADADPSPTIRRLVRRLAGTAGDAPSS